MLDTSAKKCQQQAYFYFGNLVGQIKYKQVPSRGGTEREWERDIREATQLLYTTYAGSNSQLFWLRVSLPFFFT